MSRPAAPFPEGRLGRRILAGTLSTFLAQNASVPLSLAASIWLLRALPVAQYGVLALLLSLGLYVSVLSHFGITSALGRYLPEYHQQRNYRAIRRLIAWALAARLAGAALVLATAPLWIGPASLWLRAPEVGRYLPQFAAYILLDVGVQIAAAALDGLLLLPRLNAARLAHAAIKLACIVWFVRPGTALDGAIAALTMSHAALFAALAAAVWHATRGGGPGWRPGELRRMARYALPWYGGKLSSLIFDVSTDLYLISYFLGPAAAGLYSFAYNAATQLMQLLPSTVLWPPLTSATIGVSQRNPDALKLVFRLVNKVVMFSVVPVAIIALLLGERIIGAVFGPQYLPATAAFIGWTLTLCLSELEQPVRMLLVVKEQSHRLFLNRFLVVYNLGAALVLIPRMGIEGAILATGSATALGLLVTLLAARRFQPSPYPWNASFGIACNSLSLLIVIWLVRPLLVDLPRLLLGLAAVAVWYAAISRMNSPFEPRELDLFGRALPGRLGRLLTGVA
jgi:O-antigen/teichoic acid export membrane protein